MVSPGSRRPGNFLDFIYISPVQLASCCDRNPRILATENTCTLPHSTASPAGKSRHQRRFFNQRALRTRTPGMHGLILHISIHVCMPAAAEADINVCLRERKKNILGSWACAPCRLPGEWYVVNIYDRVYGLAGSYDSGVMTSICSNAKPACTCSYPPSVHW